MNISDYLSIVNKRLQTGISREHAYRGDLQQLLETLLPDILATNEPARIACGAPDYVLTRKDVPVGYIEAKDIGIDLGSKTLKEQLNRYRAALDNLIITDYLDFHFYKNGEPVTTIALAKLDNGVVQPLHDNAAQFELLMQNFVQQITQSIKSPTKLAKMMASKAKLMANVIESALDSDEATDQNSDLKAQMTAFQSILIHDMSNRGFADMYAQTIAYGLFAARYHDSTLATFSRQEAATLIPKSNPFLRKLFTHIAANDLDDRLVWILDELVSIFLASDVAAIMSNFGESTRQNDPIIHFYETFLAEYDPKLRKSRGVWYTPEPVVNFIVRAVDDVLKSEFGLSQGLADNSKMLVKQDIQGTAHKKNKGKTQSTDINIHRVQILDPATGTGTFLAETIRHIYDNHFANMQGAWQGYVTEHLIPRLNGFELLMTSYAMAHLKLDILLGETGYKPDANPERMHVYLTNSLEEYHPDTGTLFTSWLSNEANEANHIKRDKPVMVVMGNPPYSVSSSNKSDWILGLIADYKKDLNERNIQPLSDDYIKFIRFGQHFVDRNGEGIVAYISNNSFIDGIIHRQMRKNLLESFDTIYVIDLHGSTKKQETALDGSVDQNVFDIMQGVSINLFVKTGKKAAGTLAKVYHHELYGKRGDKYEALSNGNIANLPWKTLAPKAPEYFFVPKDFAVEEVYKKGFSVSELFTLNSSGISTHRDDFVIDIDLQALRHRMMRFFDVSISDSKIRAETALKDNRDWSMSEARQATFDASKIQTIMYRPFDNQSIYYDANLIDFGREKIMCHILQGSLALLALRQSRSGEMGSYAIAEHIVGKDAISSLDRCTVFPLYLYPRIMLNGDAPTRIPNLDLTLVKTIADGLDMIFTAEKIESVESVEAFAPIDLLDYVYAILHSPNYRETYKEFLKTDFPRVPYPADAAQFWQLVALGGQLRKAHLLESDVVTVAKNFVTSYPIAGAHLVDKPTFALNADGTSCKVWINAEQYFDGVPQVAWEFYIGGYQPAQKWLKDRKGRHLNFDDIVHYQRIIAALTETHRLMGDVDGVLAVDAKNAITEN